jgi:hypothetical protein
MKVFISHASTDAELAERVGHTLKQEGFEVWDQTEVLPGDNWGRQLGQALESSEAMVVLLTPAWLQSPSMASELGFALGNRNYEGRLIPVVAAPPEQLPRDWIPWVLRRFRILDISKRNGAGDEELSKIADALRQAA